MVNRALGLGSTLGYGVIGNTEVSGTFVLGSSPGTPASFTKTVEVSAVFFFMLFSKLSESKK